jgi:glutathione peroxidase
MISLLKTNKNLKDPIKQFYNIEISKLDGNTLDLNEFKGKYILIVNVASECGFTGQYKELEELYKTYHDKLMVIGVPCNQFGSQEPGNANQIQNFCKKNFGVSFILTEKINVKGSEQHKLYQWLTSKELNATFDSSVKWNFQKYLLSPKGQLIDVFYSITKPMSKKIIKHLK